MKKLKKMMVAIMAVMLAANTGVSVFAGNSAEYNANGTAADYTLSSPRIKPATVAGQKVTYDCVWFGSYPQTEIKEGDSAYTSLQSAAIFCIQFNTHLSVSISAPAFALV